MSQDEPQDSTIPTYYIGRPGEIARMIAETPRLTPEDAAKLRRLLDIKPRRRVKPGSEEEKTL